MLLHAVNTIEELVAGTIFSIHDHAAKNSREMLSCEGESLYSITCEDVQTLGELTDILKDCCEIRAMHAANKMAKCARHERKKCHGGEGHVYAHSTESTHHHTSYPSADTAQHPSGAMVRGL